MMDELMLNNIINNYKTPAYIFDIREAKKRIEYLRNKLPKKVKLCYAIKANTFIVKDIEKYIDRFEVCSPGEYYICKESNVESNKILISGVYKSEEFIQEITTNNPDICRYTVESLEQFEIYKKIKSKQKINLMIRITSGNQFGINVSDAEEIIKNRLNFGNIIIDGIQYFSGTQKTSIKNLQKELNFVDTFIKNMKEKYGFEAKELEFGPGFPIFYFQNSEFDEDSFMDEFSNVLNNVEYNGELVLELGRSLAASCGKYITRVVDKKTNKSQNYAILDGGINHIVYYGQSMAMKIPKCEIYPKRNAQDEEKWNLCGSLCTINDILVKQFPVSNLQIGDIFIFKNTGAYCMTEGISLFLSRDLPQVIKIKEDETIELIRKDLPTYKFNM